jgi:lipopolysaccharide export system protein LptC
MSERSSVQAIRERHARLRWAVKGSSHDVKIRVASAILPIAAAVLAAIMLFAPLASNRDVSFVLAKNNVAVARERLRITEALYRGEDSAGRAFQLRAGSAVQATSKDPIVKLSQLSAEINMIEGPASMHANGGRYDMDSETVNIEGPMVFKTADGYQVSARDVSLNLKTRQLNSGGMVDGRIPLGSFSAGRLHADLATHAVTLDGHAHLHIDQRGGRGMKL